VLSNAIKPHHFSLASLQPLHHFNLCKLQPFALHDFRLSITSAFAWTCILHTSVLLSEARARALQPLHHFSLFITSVFSSLQFVHHFRFCITLAFASLQAWP
jgi:hypothetical protein